ncbi:glutamine-hydrolyzing GMP synthase [Candidatus Daviesbacteria bacterium]|nr:glutamine-hydrolyzing GMP synthase [Candidatus Daviesbacteria bacterium]
MIILVDFGSQTAHLISRRIRELGVEVKVVEPEGILKPFDLAQGGQVQDDGGVDGIIFSGGPASVYEKGAPTLEKKIFELGIPILGICYGQQLMCHLLGGEVKPGFKKEYGRAVLRQQATGNSGQLLKNIPSESTIWMSHGDEVVKVPPGFETVATTETIPHAVIENEKMRIYGIQFHPEVVHTQFGMQILENFLKICGLTPKRSGIDQDSVENIIQDIKESVQNGKVICALSGGVDSSVAALLVHKAIGKNLTSIYVESGLMREGETENLKKVFKDHYKMNVQIVDAKDLFLKNLRKVVDPEQKRRIIGKVFIEVFEKEAQKIHAKFLVQGTIYPDVIESAGSKHSKTIKSHHNVGGLPLDMKLKLIEPLRQLYKDQVRQIGKILGLPESITQRQPFPGPGLAVRIIGEVTEEKLDILRKADAIVTDELKDIKLWQAFAVLTGIKTTGVRGDNRAYGQTLAIRAIEAKDTMSANFARLPYELLDKISTRIVNEVKEVNRVVYDITNKPPATMEWE